MVDDTEAAVLALTMHLRKKGGAVTRFMDGQLFVNHCVAAPSHNWDAVVLDHTMPNLTGLQTLETLRERKCLELMPPVVVFSTETSQAALRDQYMAQSEVKRCVAKTPAGFREVVEAICAELSVAGVPA